MKSQISFIAMAIIVATTALGFATVGRLPSLQPHVTTPIGFTNSSAASTPRRVYCYNGIKGEPGNLYRGWVCESERAPKLTN
ncbi:MAG TPA: hypothetical protein VMU78_06115 [Methylocella sp.]|nr:hypothetical protein [Methylocella sp.]